MGWPSSNEYEISDKEFDSSRTEPLHFSEAELSDLVRDLNLSIESPEVLASRLKENNLLELGKLVTYYRNQDTDFSAFFKQITQTSCIVATMNSFFFLVLDSIVLVIGNSLFLKQSLKICSLAQY